MAARDAYGKCPVKWYIDELGKKRWVCFQHLAPYTRFQETSERCWYSTCPGRSMLGYPLTQEEINAQKAEKASETIKKNEPLVQIEETSKQCANYGCPNKIASSRKKYCSDKCRKQKARADYEARNPGRRNKKSEDKPISPPKPVPPPKLKVSQTKKS